jgi:predicted phosphodiesterase
MFGLISDMFVDLLWCRIAVMKTTLIVPDLQIPLHDERFLDKLLAVTEYIEPDVVAFVGDLTDSTEVGQWVKGKSGEYTGKLQEAFDRAAATLAAFREAAGRSCGMLMVNSNHDDRTEKYIADNAPGLSGLRSLDFRALVGLDAAGVQLVRGPFCVAPSTVMVHGHERAYSSVPGKYGLDRVREYDANVIYGHTHTPLVVTTTIGTGTAVRTRWAMNVGHGMDKSKAGYLKDGYATWNQAFGLVHDDGFDSFPELVLAQNGSFMFDGVKW